MSERVDGETNPTIKQLQSFSKKVYLPFGYFFLPEPPKEEVPIPYFRSQGSHSEKLSINVQDAILLTQQRQDWLKDYFQDNDFEPLPFVGRFKGNQNLSAIINDMKQVLGLEDNWAGHFSTWTDALNHMATTIEDIGIIITFNGIVGNNTKRPIPVEQCRGFVLVDDYVPFMFVNNRDFKSAQMFTLVHELAHIWTGHSAGFDFRKLQPADDPIEKLCDQIAAEFLVPESAFNDAWEHAPNTAKIARHFKVSEIVIARRALDAGKWNKKEFFEFYDSYAKLGFIKKPKKQPVVISLPLLRSA